MNPFFLYSETTERNQPEELEVVQQIFGTQNVGTLIHNIPAGSIVIPRFRAIPFGKELEQEIQAVGSQLVNSFKQHQQVANLFNWVGLLERLTPPAYTVDDIPNLPEGEWFVKGATNSIKNRWFDCCYAPTTKDLTRVVRNNQLDMYVGTQELVIRPFQSYRKIGEAVDGRPVFNERRCFFFDGELISAANYWSSFPEYQVKAINPDQFTIAVNEAIKKVGDIARFMVVDFAEYVDGSWGVVEINDGVMSGLSDNPPAVVWQHVYDAIRSL